ncbi:hypothetical protein A2U01_0101488 [Trifolium medium]|uniref:Uncharacterized protein n=1 Tax=Trifolium medium TaxID=97028 RepID=A0A392UWK6_9FABA|nr:hypothetical protein [Trifolium medium]
MDAKRVIVLGLFAPGIVVAQPAQPPENA